MSSEVLSEKPRASEAALVWCAAAVALLIWGATPMVTRIAVLEIEPSAVGILRTVLAALLALPLAVALRLRRPEAAREWGQLTVSALGGFVLFPVLFGLGVRQTSASHAALVLAVSPLFTGLIAAAVERRAPSRTWRLGAGLAFAGEVALGVLRSPVSEAGASLGGDLLVLLACIAAAAAGYVAGARLSRNITTWATTFWGIGLGGLILVAAGHRCGSGHRPGAARARSAGARSSIWRSAPPSPAISAGIGPCSAAASPASAPPNSLSP